MNKRLFTGKCRHLLEAMRVSATAADYELRACRDRVDAVEEDDVIHLTGPEVRAATTRRSHVHRLHPVWPRGVASVQLIRWTPVVAEDLKNITDRKKVKASKHQPLTALWHTGVKHRYDTQVWWSCLFHGPELTVSLRTVSWRQTKNSCSFYRAANSIFRKIGRTVSEKVVLQVISTRCIGVARILSGVRRLKSSKELIRELFSLYWSEEYITHQPYMFRL